MIAYPRLTRQIHNGGQGSSIRKGLVVAIVLFVSSLAAAQATDRLLGVNRDGLAWLKPDEAWMATIDRMAGASVPAVRMNLLSLFSKTLDVVAYAGKKNIKVVLVIPLTFHDFYSAGATPRPREGNFREINRISQIDLDRFTQIWNSVVNEIDSRGLRVLAFEIGNEFNSAYFNGDLPIVKGGAILSAQTAREYSFWPDFEAGMRKLVDVARIVATSVRNTESLHDTKVLLGAPAKAQTDWLRRSGNALADPKPALRTLSDLGIQNYVDGYAVHIYPDLAKIRPAKRIDALRRQLDLAFAPLSATFGLQKPFWITEWGFGKEGADEKPRKSGKPASRLPLFCAFLAALDQSQWSDNVPATFIFDWDESSRFEVWTGSQVLGDSISLFEDNGSKACAHED
jgi:hypothetical protein